MVIPCIRERSWASLKEFSALGVFALALENGSVTVSPDTATVISSQPYALPSPHGCLDRKLSQCPGDGPDSPRRVPGPNRRSGLQRHPFRLVTSSWVPPRRIEELRL